MRSRKTEILKDQISNLIMAEYDWELEFDCNTSDAMLSDKFTKDDVKIAANMLGLKKDRKKQIELDKKKKANAIEYVYPYLPGCTSEMRRTKTDHELRIQLYELQYSQKYEDEKEFIKSEIKKEGTQEEIDTDSFDENDWGVLTLISNLITSSKNKRDEGGRTILNTKVKEAS